MAKTRMVGHRWFACPICNSRLMVTKYPKHMTPKGHRKWLWCYRCKAEVNMIQIS